MHNYLGFSVYEIHYVKFPKKKLPS